MGGDEGDGDGAPSPSHPLVREGLKMRMVKRQGGEIVSREEGRWERRKLWWEKRNKERGGKKVCGEGEEVPGEGEGGAS